MNVNSILNDVVKALTEFKLEAIIIGNSAAALQGAPVTTIDIDFYIRDSGQSLEKMKNIAEALEAELRISDRAVSRMYQVINAEAGIFLDFLDAPIGMGSFASVRSRSEKIEYPLAGKVYVASLRDVIDSKKKVARAKDLAVIPILEKTLKIKEALKHERQRSE
jgi:hypothetical protein